MAEMNPTVRTELRLEKSCVTSVVSVYTRGGTVQSRIAHWSASKLDRLSQGKVQGQKLPILCRTYPLSLFLRDASRAFVSGNFTGDGLTDSLHGLSSNQVKSVVEWRDFYFKTYIYVGKLVGRYYDSEGNPTKYLKGAEAKAARGAQLMEKQKNEEAKLPTCNSRWSQEEGSEVWCDKGYPRLVQRPLEMAITGKVSKRCACFTEDELNQPGLEVYEGCDHLSKLCRL